MELLKPALDLLASLASKLEDHLPAVLVGGLVIEGGRHILNRIHEKRGMLTGEWQQCVYDSDAPDALPNKHDVVKARQRGDRVEADITRQHPADQRRRWHFVGRYQDGLLFGHFWSVTPRYPSYGTIVMRQENTGGFAGFYVRMTRTIISVESDTVTLQKIRLAWLDCKRAQVQCK
jgi:hypothetical protein